MGIAAMAVRDARTSGGLVISRTDRWSGRSSVSACFGWVSRTLPIIPELRVGGAFRRIGVRRRCRPPNAHASHVHQSYPESPQAYSGKDFTSHVISM